VDKTQKDTYHEKTRVCATCKFRRDDYDGLGHEYSECQHPQVTERPNVESYGTCTLHKFWREK